MFLGDYKLGDTLTIPLVVVNTTGTATDATALPTFRIYAGSVAAGDTDLPVATGTMVLRDSLGTNGWYTGTVLLSSAAGFANNKSYTVFCTGIIDGQTPATPYIFNIGTTTASVTTGTSGPTYITVDEARLYLPAETALTDAQLVTLISLSQETVESITGQKFVPVDEARVLNGSGLSVLDVRDSILSVSQIRFKCGTDWEVQTFDDVRIGRSGMMISLGNSLPGRFGRRAGLQLLATGCNFPPGFQNVEITGEWGRFLTVPLQIKAAVGLLVKYAAECDDPAGVPTTPYASEGVSGDRSYVYRRIFDGAKTHGETGFADVDAILARFMRVPSAGVA